MTRSMKSPLRLSTTANKVLIIEDEPDVADLLALNLRRSGSYQISTAADGVRGLMRAREETPDLIILDWMLPGISGLEICLKLRGDARARQPSIIMVTAKSASSDCLMALEAGADDYVTKPFSPREVVLRAGVVLRTHRESPMSVLTVGAITLDQGRHHVTVLNHPVILARIEFNLLSSLMKHPGELCTRDQLLSEVWGYEKTMITRTVDTHIRRLRRKLGKQGELIETVRTYGYRIRNERRTA